MDGLIAELKGLKKLAAEKTFLLMGRNYSSIDIEKKNFHQIPEVSKDKKTPFALTFIDGGQAALFESAGFCLGYIRVAALTYENNKRVSRDMEEFHILIKSDGKRLVVNTFPKNGFDNLSFDPEDDSIRNGNERASTSRILSVIRRFAELQTAGKYTHPVLDGTLEARYPEEFGYIDSLDTVSSIAKTCSLVTNTGIGITGFLESMNTGSWYYHPIIQNNNKSHPAQIYFIKLLEKSDYVFRFEHKGEYPERVIALLRHNSMDPVFLGYPYGLIDADSSARITQQERQSLQTQISVRLGADWNSFSKSLKSMDAHGILDNIRF